MSDIGRDELIDARNEKKKLIGSIESMGRAVGSLMEDRVRHVAALQKIARMTETGIIAQGGAEVHRIAREALEAETDMSWWPAS